MISGGSAGRARTGAAATGAAGASGRLELPAGKVQVWSIRLDPPAAEVARLAQALSPDERQRAGRFRFERHRRQYAVGRGALRHLLACYLGAAPESIGFAYGPRGKPALAAADARGAGSLEFNLSNSHELALAAFVRGAAVGVDLEHLKPLADLERIAERFFSAGEREALRALPAEQKREGFFNCWTRKEAYLKAVGEGLAARLDSFEVTLAPGEPPRMLALEGDAARAAAWFLHHLRPAGDYLGALAIHGGTWQVTLHAFPPCAPSAPSAQPGTEAAAL